MNQQDLQAALQTNKFSPNHYLFIISFLFQYHGYNLPSLFLSSSLTIACCHLHHGKGKFTHHIIDKHNTISRITHIVTFSAHQDITHTISDIRHTHLSTTLSRIIAHTLAHSFYLQQECTEQLCHWTLVHNLSRKELISALQQNEDVQERNKT